MMSTGVPGCFGCATPFLAVQVWASHHLHGHPSVKAFMTSAYGWPTCETLHFLGLSLLVGTVGMFDLRVLGIAKGIPVTALHRMVRWGIAGYVINVITGFMFLMAFPDQYLYQWPFILKIGFMTIAGINALVFNVAVMPQLSNRRAGKEAPVVAKILCGSSLVLWVAVIFAGRFLAFYKPLFTLPPP